MTFDNYTLTVNDISSTSISSSLSCFNDIKITGYITIGDKTFSAQQLGDLLQFLLDEHPEIQL